jgi:RNA polymerase sigma factor (TIGR02999 family)
MKVQTVSDVTRILSEIEQGDPAAAEQLLPLVYDELRKLAAAKLAQEKPGHTLQATALVHEAYLRLVDTSHPQAWKHRGHFFSAAAESMRRILVESARRRAAGKRGGAIEHGTLKNDPLASGNSPDELLGIHEALDQLAAQDRQSAELVKLRYFAGLRMDEAAAVLGISVRKAHYTWAYARSWLRRELGDDC